MNSESFLEVLTHNEALLRMKAEEAEELVRRYPYFEAARFALLKKLKNDGDYRFNEALSSASVHCSDRKTLFLFVEKVLNVSENKEEQEATKEHEPVLTITAADDQVENSASEINSINEIVEPAAPVVSPDEPSTTIINIDSESLFEVSETLNSSTAGDTNAPGSPVVQSLEIGVTTDPDLPIEEVRIPLTAVESPSTPVQRKPRIQWTPEQALEAPNDILSQILAYPDLAGRPAEITKTDYSQTGDRSFSDWLKATRPKPATGEPQEKHVSSVIPVKEAPKASFFNPVEMARKSVEDRDDVVSETLAKVYISQGDPNRAVRIYHKLSLLYPEKSAYFAALIEKIVKPS